VQEEPIERVQEEPLWI